MAAVLQFTRRLEKRPLIPEIPGVRLRNYAGPQDIPLWLAIRNAAFAGQKVGVRRWDESDFAAEFLEKRWWDPRGMWFAETHPSQAAGTISLAWRGRPPDTQPAIHWLAVSRGCRRRGIGRLLLSALEAACWDQGHRQIWLETHAGWTEAIRFYQALGYKAIADGF